MGDLTSYARWAVAPPGPTTATSRAINRITETEFLPGQLLQQEGVSLVI